MRLYDPTGGTIFIMIKNIAQYNLDDYHKRFGVVFQDFKMYDATLMENVVLDDIENIKKKRRLSVRRYTTVVLVNAWKHFPKGLYTSITSEFDESGVNLSGGEPESCHRQSLLQAGGHFSDG